MKIKVMLADDHQMFREMLRLSLQMQPDMSVVAEAGLGREVGPLLASAGPDVLVLDVNLPDQSGIEVARRVSLGFPRVRVVALSAHTEPDTVQRMIQAGAVAYVLKTSAADELLYAVRAAFRGHRFVSPEVAHFTWKTEFKGGTALAKSPLSPREQEVLCLLAQGHRSYEVAVFLGISKSTVDVHRRTIKHKLGVRTVSDMTRYAIRTGLLSA